MPGDYQLCPCCPVASTSEAVRTLLKILQDGVVAASWTAVASRRTELEDGRAAAAGRWAVDQNVALPGGVCVAGHLGSDTWLSRLCCLEWCCPPHIKLFKFNFETITIEKY